MTVNLPTKNNLTSTIADNRLFSLISGRPGVVRAVPSLRCSMDIDKVRAELDARDTGAARA